MSRYGQNTMALVLGVALASVTFSSAAAQTSPRWNEPEDPYVAAIGLAGGASSGAGLAVRWPGLSQTMLGVAGGVWSQDGDVDWNVGLEVNWILRQANRLRIFVGPSAAFFSDDNGDNTEEDVDLNIAVGVGIEYLMRPRFSVKFDVGFTYLGDDGDVFPLPQLGVFFYF